MIKIFKKIILLLLMSVFIFTGNIFYSSAVTLYNVKTDFNAAGDGLTDDTKSIQEALNTAATTGFPVYIPAGTYLISSLTISSGVKIYGDGPASSIIKRKSNSTNQQYSMLLANMKNGFLV